MEYDGNTTLKDFIQKNKGNLDENIIEKIIIQICLGLKEIHRHSIIHRDLRPENIMINEKNEIKIIDFGLSKELLLTKYTKSKVGSFFYSAPEIRNEEEILYDNRVDIYSLGCIIYELFTGNKYFNDKMGNKDCKINKLKYNEKWQNIIDSLLKNDYKERPFIELVINSIGINKILITNIIEEPYKKYYVLNESKENEYLEEIDKYNSELYIKYKKLNNNELYHFI